MSFSLLFTTRSNSSFVSTIALILSLSLYISIKFAFLFPSCAYFTFLLTYAFSLTPLAWRAALKHKAKSVEFWLIFNLNLRLHHSSTVNINYNGRAQHLYWIALECVFVHSYYRHQCCYCTSLKRNKSLLKMKCTIDAAVPSTNSNCSRHCTQLPSVSIHWSINATATYLQFLLLFFLLLLFGFWK